MINLSVGADIGAGVDLLGKSVSDLQTGVSVGANEITGTLKYVSDYTGFSSNVAEQSGNYLAIHCDTDVVADSITVELIGGTVGHPVTLDSDGLIVLRITNTATQSVRVVATKGSETVTKTFSLTGLTLNQS